MDPALKELAYRLIIGYGSVEIHAEFFAFLDGKVVILKCGFFVPILRLLHISLYANGILIEPGEIALTVTVAVIRGSACPHDRLSEVFLHTEAIVIEVTNLALSKRITLLGKSQMSLKAPLVPLGIKVFFNQLVADVKLSARLIVWLGHFLLSLSLLLH